MKKLNNGIKILVAFIVSILLGIWIGLTYDKSTIFDTPSRVPPRPDSSRPMYYKFNEEEWKYLFRGPRANGVTPSSEPYPNEQDLQEYMEKKVPGYLEDSYWGQEYDLDGQINDQ